MKLILIFITPLLLSSCASIVGGIAGGAAAAKGPDPDTIQTLVVRSRYEVECASIKKYMDDFISNNEDIIANSSDAPNLCSEIKSTEEIFKNCITVDPKDEYKITDGTFWSSYDFYLIQVQKKEKTCDLLLYTRADFDLQGNPFSTKSSCQNGFDKKCEDKFENAKEKREKIKASIEKRSKITFKNVKEEKIFNYYITEKARMAFEN